MGSRPDEASVGNAAYDVQVSGKRKEVRACYFCQ